MTEPAQSGAALSAPAAPAAPAPSLEDRVVDLEADMTASAQLIEVLAEQAKANAHAVTPDGQRHPWRLLGDLDDDAPFTVWVAWLGSHYVNPVDDTSIVYDCWRNHDAVVAELGTLWQAWRWAFVNPKADPDSAQNWHDRWLPGFMARRATWYHKECINGHCHLEGDR